MIVLDHEPSAWFFVRDETRLLLDVSCSHGAVDYAFLMALNEVELQAYEKLGRDFISRLAHQIHCSAPGVRGNASAYRDRSVMGAERQKVEEVILAWVRERRNAP